jgi:NitT/TauT family transport system substrate-binding protein
MKHSRMARIITVLAVVTLFGFVLIPRTLAHPQRALTPVTLQLKWVPQAQFGGYFVALDKGFYKNAGLNVTIKPGGPDIAPEQVVASGGAQIGIDWLSALLAARDRGLPVQNIAQIYQASGMRLVAFKSTGITSIQGFKHKKVGVWFSGNEYQFMALMNKYHMSPPSQYMTVVKEPFTMDSFLNHQMDVAHAMTYNEMGVIYEHGVKPSQLRVWDYNKLGVSILEDGLFANPSWASAHRSTVVAFLKASIQGWKYAVAHPKEAGQISYKHAPSGTSTESHQIFMAQQVAKLITYGPGKSHAIGYMDPASYKRTWQTLLQEKVIKKAPKNAFDQSYWKAASRGM